MTWNVEGLRTVLTATPILPLQDNDILLFSETFATKDTEISGFHGIHSPAKKGEKGRPTGGLSCFVKPHLQPFSGIKCTDNTITITTRAVNIVGAYFPPNIEPENIIDDIGKAMETIDNDKPTILAGDLNCRIDKWNTKAQTVIDLLMNYGLRLLNQEQEFTYVAPNGRSTIDLIFTDSQEHAQIKIEKYAIRKHLPVITKLQLSKTTEQRPNRNCKPKVSRHIDEEKWETRKMEIPTIMNMIRRGKLDKATTILTENIVEAANNGPRAARTAKPWFDVECYTTRQRTLRLLHEARTPGQDVLTEYAEQRRKYKLLLKEKRTAYDLQLEQKLIAEAERKPYKILQTSMRKHPSPLVNMEQWENHFSNLLGGKDGPPNNPIPRMLNTKTQSNEPITADEVASHIRYSKNNKATGPDGIYAEHLKTLSPDLTEPLTLLLNECLRNNTIPQQWRKSIIVVIHKGKGRKDDPNNYRGIALENTMYKLFSKILLGRIEQRLRAIIPRNQFGFTPGRSTLQAVQEILLEITTNLTQPNSPVYAIFIDYAKAFDSIDRKILCRKLENTLGRACDELETIKSILNVNYVTIHDGISMSKEIAQTRGVLQGDPMSPVLFNVMTADIGQTIGSRNVKLLMYADDMAILSKNREELQEAMENIRKWALENSMEINSTKTKAMKFRRGGRVAKNDHFKCGETALEIVPSFKYLGVTLQTTGTTFTMHIQDRTTAATNASYDIPNLQRLSLPTAMTLFRIKVAPVATYGIQIIWPHLTMKNLRRLENVKARYIKRALSLSKYTRNSYAYLIANETYFIEDIRITFNLQRTQAYEDIIKERQDKAKTIPREILETDAMKTDEWKGPNYQLRHLYTRFAAHGFHGKICQNASYHDPKDDCRCTLCNEPCSKYHLMKCNSRTQPLISFTKDW